MTTEHHAHHPHARSIDKLLALLDSSLDEGLDESEVVRRQARYGKNLIEDRTTRGTWRLVLDQFTDVMVVVLIGAAIVASAVGEPEDAVAIAAIVVLNAALGFSQSYRAEQALTALRSRAAPSAMVRRGGIAGPIAASELVPGDVVLLEAGNIVPADIRIAEARALTIDESLLTGESQNVEKTADVLPAEDLPLGDRLNLAYKGTTVTAGRGVGLVVATGTETELGRIATLLREVDVVQTPLQKRLAVFGRRLSIVAAIVCVVVFASGILRGEPPALMLLTSLSLAVAAIPEALPAVVTVALALGARRMIRRQALIRHLPAVETLGSVTVICTDKTGTLTENHMRATDFWVGGRSEVISASAALDAPRFFEALALCNDVQRGAGNTWTGDPTEIALVEAAERAGFAREPLARRMPRIAEQPFSSARGMMTTQHRTAGSVVSFTKGAPEIVLERCTQILVGAAEKPLERTTVAPFVDRLAAEGKRVLAVACREGAVLSEDGLSLIGLVALMDPPRTEAAGAVAVCRAAGIRPVMITGDHPSTARAIAQSVGILDRDSEILSGADLHTLDPPALADAVARVRVYARVAPDQKIAIVTALQHRGELVAMTGDGVNDAPAIKRADIGVAMGKTGTDVAREAADMVLLDDNFATIVSAVREGRRIFDNIRRFIRYVLCGNAGEIWTLLLAPVFGLPTPLAPVQILWINLVTDGLPGLALTIEPEERTVMRRPPRPPSETVFAHGVWQQILWVGLLIAGLTLAGATISYRAGSAHWQTVAFTVLTMTQLFLAMSVRSSTESLFTQGIGSNLPLHLVVLATAALHLSTIYVGPLNRIFKTTPLTGRELALSVALASIVFFAVEIEKWIRRRANRASIITSALP